MPDLAPPFRFARVEDAPALADLIHEASHGISLAFWRMSAKQGEDPWTLGRARQAARVAAGTSTIVVADEGQGAVAGLTGYSLGPEPTPLDDLPPLFVPLIELENEAPGTWYINVLATLPQARRRGLASGLLAIAEAAARAEGCRALSLIVADANTDARRLYARAGFTEAARRPIVKEGWVGEGTDWLLLLKPLA